jgi:hypothetical protein
MPELVIFLTPDTERAENVIDRWRNEGVSWAFIFETRALVKAPEQLSRDDMPLFPSLQQLVTGGLMPTVVVAGLAPDSSHRVRMLAAIPSDSKHGQTLVLPVSQVVE